ncbi:MAG: hypothetical protein LUG58_06445, partial [Clostridiales bacterium]|nr:hypothetical protein [Clostridiales bacterium]
QKAQAAQDARRLVADAEKASAQKLAQAREKARAENAALMTQAEQNAAAHLAAVVRETEGACDQLRAEAQGRLEKAASLIVRRVVDG